MSERKQSFETIYVGVDPVVLECPCRTEVNLDHIASLMLPREFRFRCPGCRRYWTVRLEEETDDRS